MGTHNTGSEKYPGTFRIALFNPGINRFDQAIPVISRAIRQTKLIQKTEPINESINE
jgi:hypothetical protein